MPNGYQARSIAVGCSILAASAGLLASRSHAGTVSTTTIDVVIDPTTTTIVSSTSTTSTLPRGRKIACPDARWELSLDGDESLGVSALQLGPNKTVTLHGICPPANGKRRPTKKGTRIKARWKKGVCDGLDGKVRVTARTDTTCETIEGKLKAKRFKRSFTGTLVSCGDGVVDPGLGETCDPPEAEGCDPLCGAHPSDGTTLPGPGTTLAVDAVFDFDVEEGVPEEELSTVDGQGRQARTRLEIEIDADMSVQEFNDMLGVVEGAVVSMLDDVPFVLIRIADPGTLDALADIEAVIRDTPGVLEVVRQWVPEPTILPSNYPFTPREDLSGFNLSFIDQLLAAHAPSAWNARLAMQTPPTMIMIDFFGNGPPDLELFDVNVLNADDFGTGEPQPNLHGYQMLSIISAKWGGPEECKVDLSPDGRAKCATGALPGPLPVRAVDFQKDRDGRQLHLIWAEVENEMIRRIREVRDATSDGNVIVSAPVRSPWTVGRPDVALQNGGRWLAKLNAAHLRPDDDFLMVASAGNVQAPWDPRDPEAPRQAYTSSPIAAAALHPNLVRVGVNSANAVVVENRVATSLYRPGTLASTSFRTDDLSPFDLTDDSAIRAVVRGSALSAVGTEVWTVYTESADRPPRGDSGTSQATALTAGIAAYLWSLRPSLSVAELKSLLVGTASEMSDAGAPTLDAMAAALSLDRSFDDAPIRRAILDIDENGKFDDDDVTAFFESTADETRRMPKYSRTDLLGQVLGGRPRAIDIDLDGDLDGATLEVFGKSRRLNERRAESTEAQRFLCYYVTSVLFEGTDAGLQQCCRWLKENDDSFRDVDCECLPGDGNQLVICPPPPPEDDLQGLWTIRSPGGDELQTFYLLNNGIVTEPSGLAWRTVGSWTRTGDHISVTPCAPRNPDFGTRPARWAFEGVAGTGLFGACEGDLDVPCAFDVDCGASAPCVQANSCLDVPCPGLIGHLTRIDAAADVATSGPTLVRTVHQGSASPAYREIEPRIEECAEWRLKDNETWVTLDCDVTLTNENTGEVLCSGDCWPEWGGRDFPHICGLSFPRSEFTRPPCGLIDGVGLPCEGQEESVGGETFEHIPFCPRGFGCTTMRKPSPSVGQYCACVADVPPPCTGDTDCFEGEFCAEPAGSADGACIDDCPTCNFFP